jgi:hypothetical protein
MIDVYLDLLELGYYELQGAFKGLADEHVWKRPAETLLSVGELAGHIAHWEAARLAGGGTVPSTSGETGVGLEPDLANCPVKSLLIDRRFKYYPVSLANPPSEEHLAMTAEQVYSELLRVHKESVAHLRALNPDPQSTPPGWDSFWTYREFLKYLIFHVSYHTGQMYSARHLLGEETPDN